MGFRSALIKSVPPKQVKFQLQPVNNQLQNGFYWSNKSFGGIVFQTSEQQSGQNAEAVGIITGPNDYVNLFVARNSNFSDNLEEAEQLKGIYLTSSFFTILGFK